MQYSSEHLANPLDTYRLSHALVLTLLLGLAAICTIASGAEPESDVPQQSPQ